jgi:hypothetical protein
MANDEVDALSALEKEAKEYDKVRDQLKISNLEDVLGANSGSKDAEIDRIIKAFRLDA